MIPYEFINGSVISHGTCIDLYNICREKAKSLLFTPVADDIGAASINREDTYVDTRSINATGLGCMPFVVLTSFTALSGFI